MPKLIVKNKNRPIPPSFDPRQFFERRNKILVIRPTGGAGDILMHRMMFEDMRNMHPDFELHFACPPQFHDLVNDHPFLSSVLDSGQIQTRDYVVSYNTASACLRNEMANYPDPQKHRSDIWAEHCGVTLTHHESHMTVSEDIKQTGRAIIDEHRQGGKPVVLLCPVAHMNVRDLLPQHIRVLANAAIEAGCQVLGCHIGNIATLSEMGIPSLYGLSIRQWIGVMSAADYVISTDTSHFHLAGALKKPLLGIFAMTNGKVYGRYYDCITVQKHRDNGDWGCGPCYDWTRCPKATSTPFPCMSLIPEDMLRKGVRDMLARWPLIVGKSLL